MRHLLLFIGILFSGMALHAQIDVNENPDPLVVCDDDNNGFAYFNLHDADADITLGDSSLYVTYHMSILDAQANINALLSPYMNQIPYADTVYAHVQDPGSDYFAVVPLDLLVQELPPINQPIDLAAEDENGDGIAIFDLTVNNAIMLGDLDPSYHDITYYVSETEAIDDEFSITDPASYFNTENPQTIYARVQNINRGCFVIASFILSVDVLSVDSFGFEDLNIFPNPTSESFTIQSSQLVSETSVSLYDIQGKLVFCENVLPQNEKFRMDVSFLKNGVYFVKITSEEIISIKKLIKL